MPLSGGSSAPSSRPRVLLIGVGNELRGDDRLGLKLVRSVREQAAAAGIDVCEEQGETTALISSWAGREAIVVVDASRSGRPPGTITRIDVSSRALPGSERTSSSTHALGLQEAIELARALGRLPDRTIVYTVEGQDFTTGSELSQPAREALRTLADDVMREAQALGHR